MQFASSGAACKPLRELKLRSDAADGLYIYVRNGARIVRFDVKRKIWHGNKLCNLYRLIATAKGKEEHKSLFSYQQLHESKDAARRFDKQLLHSSITKLSQLEENNL